MTQDKQFYHCFEIGDLVADQSNGWYVILDVFDSKYKFIRLQELWINVIGEGRVTFKKGDTATQPCSIFDKYHLLYDKKHQP